MGKRIKGMMGTVFMTWFMGMLAVVVGLPALLWAIKTFLWLLLALVYTMSGNAPEGFWG